MEGDGSGRVAPGGEVEVEELGDGGDAGGAPPAGAGTGAGGGAQKVVRVNADLDAFAKNFIGAYDTGNVEQEVPLLDAQHLDFGTAQTDGAYGVRGAGCTP